jgi:uncharacterized YigZ family protein
VTDGPTIRTLAGRWRTELPPIRGSRFLADVAPVEDEAAAFAFLDEVRAREPDATHHCWAFRLPDGRERASDAGEPRDTAGPPILRRIAGADVAGVVVVVRRHDGGTQLGRGGLVRAYGEAAAAVLAEAPVVERPVVERFHLRFPYELTGTVEAVLAAFDADTRDAAYGADVSLDVAVPVAGAEAFAAALSEATAGRASPQN